MTSDSLVVVGLVLGFLYMIGVGTCLQIQDDARPVVGRLFAGAGVAVGLILLL